MIENLGKNFKRYRKAAGLKQSEIAEILNISTDTISRMEQGKSVPGLETLNEIAKILNIPLDYLVCDESKQNLMFSSVVFVERLKGLNEPELRTVTEVLQSAFEYINIKETGIGIQNHTEEKTAEK